jgi:hypothetical protein
MIPKPLASITLSDLQALVNDAVPEGKTLDYKQTLPGPTDSDKKEFLADVSSFANTGGGDLIFGMPENQGVPTSVAGFTTGDIDLELRRLDSLLATGLDPRIQYASKVLDNPDGSKVLILRCEKGWSGPHRVIFRGHDKFYGRNSAGKYPLDVGELRTAFTLSATITERIEGFRTDRIIALSNNQTPVPFTPEPKIILHCIPVAAFTSRAHYDVHRYRRDVTSLRPMYYGSNWDVRINLDGVVAFSGGQPAHSYTQVYRTGIIEVVTGGGLLAHEYNGKMVIPSIAYEKAVIDYWPTIRGIYSDLNCGGPVVIALTLTGTRGLRMGVDSMGWDFGVPLTTDTLIVPETLVEDLDSPVGIIFKPMFDLVWNACGYPASKNFDGAGNWVNRR